jgi:hypothetical protein
VAALGLAKVPWQCDANRVAMALGGSCQSGCLRGAWIISAKCHYPTIDTIVKTCDAITVLPEISIRCGCFLRLALCKDLPCDVL